jgi:signal transduction histidine kinase
MKPLEQVAVMLVSQRAAWVEARERALKDAGAKVTIVAPDARADAADVATDVIIIGDVGASSPSTLARDFVNDARVSRAPTFILASPVRPIEAHLDPESASATIVHPRASDEAFVQAVRERVEPARHIADSFVRNRSLQGEIMLRMEREDEMRHETQTLFHGVRGLLEIIATSTSGVETAQLSGMERASLQKVREACADASRLIDHSQNPSRRTTPPNGKTPSSPPSVRLSTPPPDGDPVQPRKARRTLHNLGDLVAGAVHMLEDAARERALSLTFDEDERCPMWGDTMQIKQIVTNLLVNAIQLSPSGGKVHVRVRTGASESSAGVKARRRAEIVIADSGPSIAAEDRDKIFSRKASGVRAGIGLSVVRELAAVHGGSVRIEDTEGGGATFIVSLPYDRRARNSRGLLVVRDVVAANIVIDALASGAAASTAAPAAQLTDALTACSAVVVLPKDSERIAAFEAALDRMRPNDP